MARVEKIVNGDTGEAFALVALAQWEAIVAAAHKARPCRANPPCDDPRCELALLVLAQDEQLARELSEVIDEGTGGRQSEG